MLITRCSPLAGNSRTMTCVAVGRPVVRWLWSATSSGELVGGTTQRFRATGTVRTARRLTVAVGHRLTAVVEGWRCVARSASNANADGVAGLRYRLELKKKHSNAEWTRITSVYD